MFDHLTRGNDNWKKCVLIRTPRNINSLEYVPSFMFCPQFCPQFCSQFCSQFHVLSESWQKIMGVAGKLALICLKMPSFDQTQFSRPKTSWLTVSLFFVLKCCFIKIIANLVQHYNWHRCWSGSRASCKPKLIKTRDISAAASAHQLRKLLRTHLTERVHPHSAPDMRWILIGDILGENSI